MRSIFEIHASNYHGGEQLKDFDEIYRLYFREVYLYSYALTRDTHLAEDITAEAFTKALSKLHTFRGECDIRTWLCQIAKNTYFAWYNEQKRLQPLDDIPVSTDTQDLAEAFVEKELSAKAYSYLHKMDEPYIILNTILK